MNILFIVAGSAAIFIVAYLTYGKFLAKKIFALDDAQKTPAVTINDGLDYVPAKKNMLLGQHFSAIAAAGPIYGPILPVIMGFLMKFAKLKEKWALLIFLPLVAVAIWAGKYMPINLPAWLASNPAAATMAWGVIILIYCVIASVVPVWALLQPRGALGGYPIQNPAFTKLAMDGGALGAGFWFPMMPLLFITIACGAMLLEGMVAVVSLACVMIVTRAIPSPSLGPTSCTPRASASSSA